MALLSGLLSVSAAVFIAYLLWPTWQPSPSEQPSRLPITIGGVLFNIPPQAIREKVQRQPGAQERVDLAFAFPSLQPPSPPHHLSPDIEGHAEIAMQRIFLTIADHHGAMSPEVRLQTIYPRYLETTTAPEHDGLVRQAFRDGSPYENEDLMMGGAAGQPPGFVARCTREAETPGTCLSERRLGGVDLTFRYPRQWLGQWREVAAAMDRLTERLHGTHD